VTRVDRLILGRVGSRIIIAVAIVFGLLVILDSLRWQHYFYLADIGGPQLAILALAAAAGRWTVRTLTVTVLVGTAMGLLDLQARQELNVLKASGNSIWKMLRAPIVAVALGGFAVAVFVEGAVIQVDRSVNPTQSSATGAVTPDGAFWLQQEAAGLRYVVRATGVQPGGEVLDDVTIFFSSKEREYDRIIAPQLRLSGPTWQVIDGVGFRVGRPAQRLAEFSIPTTSTAADLRVRLSSTADMTFIELVAALSVGLTDPLLVNAVATRFLRLVTLPLSLVASVLVAAAFTAGYRRTNKYGTAVLYGMVIGFVVFFVTEMADRAGSAGAMDPTFAALAPAIVAAVVGLTVLLFREDGRA
jgi:lipopolysaccharide export system permease protein